MFKCRRVGVVFAGVVLAGCSIAQAASGRSISQTIALAAIRHTGGYASPGSAAVYAGTVKSKLGRGAIIDRITITAHPTQKTFRFTGTSTSFYARGTSKSRISGTMTVQPNGSLALAGHGRYVGGTGLYRRAHGGYSFTATAPALPPLRQPPACAAPARSKLVASDAQVVVVLDQVNEVQEIRYCNIAKPSLGFRLLATNDYGAALGGSTTITTVDGVAGPNVLYDSGATYDSPGCGGVGVSSSDVYTLDISSGITRHLWQGPGEIRSGSLAPTGVAAWMTNANDIRCQFEPNPRVRQESLEAYDLSTGTLTTLDMGDPNEMPGSPVPLGNLELYPCAAGCPATTTVIAWTHDGAWRYAQIA
jgi:hypothetical protein